MDLPISVLFICMGNICRSPAAEGIFRKMVDQAGLTAQFHIDSAGTTAFHSGSCADSRMQQAARKRGYALESRSRPVIAEDFRRFRYLIAMDRENLRDLLAMAHAPEDRAKISLMCDYAREHDEQEVPDPYYGGAQGFEKVMDLLEDSCRCFLAELCQRHQLRTP